MLLERYTRRILLVTSLISFAALGTSCSSDNAGSTAPDRFQSQAQGPSTPAPTPPPVDGFEMAGTIRNQATVGGIAAAQIEIIDGVNVGRSTSSDGTGAYRLTQLRSGAMRVRVSASGYVTQAIDVPLTGNMTLNFELTPVSTYVYSGIVTDGVGRPVVGATVRGGPDSGVTDSNGRYEFRSPYPSVAGNVYPPQGYEPKPVRPIESFPLVPGQNISIRRITGVTMTPPSTVKVGAHVGFAAQISFDTGQNEFPNVDAFTLTSSDTSILRTGSGAGWPDPYVEGVKEGTAAVTGRYFGVSTATFQVQVVP